MIALFKQGTGTWLVLSPRYLILLDECSSEKLPSADFRFAFGLAGIFVLPVIRDSQCRL